MNNVWEDQRNLIVDAEYSEISPSPEDIETGDDAEANYNKDRVVQPDMYGAQEQVYQDGKPVVSKRHEIILASYSASTLALKVMNAVFTQLDPNSTSLQPITLRVADLAHLLDMTPQSIHPEIKNISNELQSLTLKTDLSAAALEKMAIADHDQAVKKAMREGREPPPFVMPKTDTMLRKNPDSFEQYNIFSMFAYDADSKRILVEFNDKLENVLIGYLRNGRGKFTYYFLEMTRGMRSVYAQRMYEVARTILTMNDVKNGKTVAHRTFEYERLRGILNVPEKSYQVFSRFESWVLQKAKEGMEGSDINISWQAVRVAGPKSKVKEIIITVFSNMAAPLPDTTDIGDSDHWRAVLGTFSAKQRNNLETNYSQNRLMRNILYVEKGIELETIVIKKTKYSLVAKVIENDTAGMEILRKLETKDATQLHFLTKFVQPRWTTNHFSDRERDDILEKGFESLSLQQMFDEFKAQTTGSKQSSRAAITKSVMDIENTEW